MSFSVSWGETVFSQRPIGPLPCPHGSWTFSTNWILLKTSRQMPQTDSWISSVLGRKNPLHFQQHDTELGHTNWGFLESDHGLISKYHMRPVLMATVLMPTCQHAMAGAMVRSLVGISLAISSCYQTFLHCVDKDTSDQLHPDPGCCERTLSPHNMAKIVVFFDVLSRY